LKSATDQWTLYGGVKQSYPLEQLGVEKRSMAGAVLMVPPLVDTGDVSVVAKDGLLESSFRRCSWKEDEADSEVEAVSNSPQTKKLNGGHSVAPLLVSTLGCYRCVVCVCLFVFLVKLTHSDTRWITCLSSVICCALIMHITLPKHCRNHICIHVKSCIYLAFEP